MKKKIVTIEFGQGDEVITREVEEKNVARFETKGWKLSKEAKAEKGSKKEAKAEEKEAKAEEKEKLGL